MRGNFWLKLSDIPNANYISLFAYNLINPIRDYPKAGVGDCIKEGFVEWNNGTAGYYLKRNQFNECADFLAKEILEMTPAHKARVKKYLSLAKALFVESAKFRKLNFEKMSDSELVETFERMAGLQRENHLYGGILTFLPDEEQQRVSKGIYSLIEKLSKENAPELNVSEAWNILTTPVKKSFREKEAIGLLEIAVLAQKEKGFTRSVLQNPAKALSSIAKESAPSIFRALKEHCEKYCWLPYMYSGPPYTMAYYCKRLSELMAKRSESLEAALKKLKTNHALVKKQQEVLLENLKPSEKERELLAFSKELVYIKGFRKDSFYHLYYSYEPFLREAGKRLRLSIDKMRFFFPWEIRKALLEKNYSKQEQRQRKKKSLYYMDEKEILFYFDKEVDKFKGRLQIEGCKNLVEEVHGMTAFPGLAKGVVKIIQEPKDMAKMQKGDILVSQMTSPDIIIAMEKAAAIVTNTGGLTCHASILSREMKIPCIVGTKIATKAFKDGDLVEVDAIKGIVRKLS